MSFRCWPCLGNVSPGSGVLNTLIRPALKQPYFTSTSSLLLINDLPRLVPSSGKLLLFSSDALFPYALSDLDEQQYQFFHCVKRSQNKTLPLMIVVYFAVCLLIYLLQNWHGKLQKNLLICITCICLRNSTEKCTNIATKSLRGPLLAPDCSRVCPMCWISGQEKGAYSSSTNGLWVGKIPDELKDLTYAGHYFVFKCYSIGMCKFSCC